MRRMHEIYSQAESYTAFLGEGTPESVNAFNTIGDWIEEADDDSYIAQVARPSRATASRSPHDLLPMPPAVHCHTLHLKH